jgi:hypothetical protein
MSDITAPTPAASVRRGPWLHRFLVHLFTALFGVLAYWLLGFVIDDIGSWPGPNYVEIENRLLDPELRSRAEALRKQIDETQRSIVDQQARQQILRDSTDNSQTTMNQLLEFQRLSLENDVKPTSEEQQALAESQQRFLANQAEYQQLNEALALLNEELRDLERQQLVTEEALAVARIPVTQEFEALQRRHDLSVAAVKLLVLVPLLVVAVVLFLRRRDSIYVPLVYAFGIAVAIKVMVVMHEYFPARYFKYILIITFLAIVTKALVSLVRMMAHPNRQWLLKQYREAYEAFLCPVCSYPIRRGPLKYLFWTRRSIRKLAPSISGSPSPEETYTCPSCSTPLYEECDACHGVRHSLLPTCEHCGATRSVEAALV